MTEPGLDPRPFETKFSCIYLSIIKNMIENMLKTFRLKSVKEKIVLAHCLRGLIIFMSIFLEGHFN